MLKVAFWDLTRLFRRAHILALHQIRHDFGNDMMKEYIKYKRKIRSAHPKRNLFQ